ncbi:MAG TPA: efflux RND transporter permease subunit, partial [Vicinamibacterales bacterium]|nr:efflux RND transporter permease subunit [Vicinamibacterales bacterium]
MFISDFAIRRPIVTTVTMLALVVFGIFALVNLDTDEFPDVQPPVVFVAVPYPGAAPATVEREVIDRLEEALSAISGVEKITSSALDGFGSLIVEFAFEKDLQEATQQIRDEISAIRNDLPPEMEEPILTRFDPADFPIVSLSLTSPTRSGAELTALADPGISRELRSVPGVAEVEVVGGVAREMVVELRPEALEASGVSIAQVVQAIQAQNLAAPVGRLTSGLEERTIRLRGRLEDAADFAALVVTGRGGRLVRLGDVARVYVGSEEPRSAALFNGQPAVGIDVVKSKGYSTTSVAEEVRARVADIQRRLPPDVSLRIVRDAGVRVERSVDNVKEALVEGAALTVLVVFLFLNSWRSTVITGLALPVSVLASFMAVWAFGFTLNTMSLLGLSLAIGILIDDAIVVRENIVRHVELGKDHYRAAREGTDEIGLAVAATTFSIVVVFVPIAFMGGVAEQWFAPFALTIACSVLVSLFVSFSLDPMLSAYWPDPRLPDERRPWISRQLARFNRWFDRQAEAYKHVIRWALHHRAAMIGLALASFVGALALPAFGVIGGAFFPVQDVSELTIDIDTPPGSSLEYTMLKAEEAARLARAKPEVAYTYTTIGGRTGAVDEGSIYVRLVPKAERRRHQDEIAAELRRELQRLGGVTAGIGTGRLDNAKQIQLQLRGPDTAELMRLAARVAEEVRRVPGAVDVGLSTKGEKPELEVRVDRGLAGALGVTVGQIAQALRVAFAGVDAGDWIDPSGETRDVSVRLAPEARARVRDLESLPLMIETGGAGATVPLGQVATIAPGLGPARIDHIDRDRVVSVEANTEHRPLTEVLADIQERLARLTLPPGYRMTLGGESEDTQEVFGRILSSLALAVLLMYFVLVIQFGSFLDPLAILLSLPLSLIGVMLALLVTGSTLNIMSMIGVILLMGIVAKNAILLIDFAKWSEERGRPRREAIVEAGRVRLRPILMTTFALIAGMVPVAIGAGEGADFRAPMGRAVIGGVITSTILTLVVIPTVYDILCGWRDGLLARVRGPRREPVREPEEAPVPALARREPAAPR